MYNSTNLPLDRKKIIKKSFPALTVSFVLILIAIIFALLVPSQSKHTASFFAVSGVSFVFAILSLFISVPALIYQYLYYKYYYYNFEGREAEIRKGVVSRATGHVQYRKIQNILWTKMYLKPRPNR